MSETLFMACHCLSFSEFSDGSLDGTHCRPVAKASQYRFARLVLSLISVDDDRPTFRPLRAFGAGWELRYLQGWFTIIVRAQVSLGDRVSGENIKNIKTLIATHVMISFMWVLFCSVFQFPIRWKKTNGSVLHPCVSDDDRTEWYFCIPGNAQERTEYTKREPKKRGK